MVAKRTDAGGRKPRRKSSAKLSAEARCLACGHVQPLPGPMEAPVCAACGQKPLFLAHSFVGSMTHAMSVPEPRSVCAVELGLPEVRVLDTGCRATPLVRQDTLGAEAGLPNLFVKYETEQPTGTFKARSALYGITWLLEHRVREYVISSTGNAATALALAAQQAGMKLHVFMPKTVPAGRVKALESFGARVVAETPTYDQAKDQAVAFAAEKGLPCDTGGWNPLTLSSMKTLAYEAFAQLGGRAPDWYVQAVSGGMGPVGVLAAFVEMHEAGLIGHVPRLLALQPEGCAPMVTSWAKGSRAFDVVDTPCTRVGTLGTGKPGLYPVIYDLCQKAPGSQFLAVDDDASDRCAALLRKRGIDCENTVGCAFAGLVKAAKDGIVKPAETVLFTCSGRGMGSPA